MMFYFSPAWMNRVGIILNLLAAVLLARDLIRKERLAQAELWLISQVSTLPRRAQSSLIPKIETPQKLLRFAVAFHLGLWSFVLALSALRAVTPHRGLPSMIALTYVGVFAGGFLAFLIFHSLARLTYSWAPRSQIWQWCTHAEEVIITALSFHFLAFVWVGFLCFDIIRAIVSVTMRLPQSRWHDHIFMPRSFISLSLLPLILPFWGLLRLVTMPLDGRDRLLAVTTVSGWLLFFIGNGLQLVSTFY